MSMPCFCFCKKMYHHRQYQEKIKKKIKNIIDNCYCLCYYLSM
ncbi:hypothetical protein [Moraxella lacunata]